MDELKKKIEKLRSLAQLDVDAAGTYDAAISRVKVESVRERLSEFRVDHMRHVQDLNRIIQTLGGEQVLQEPDLKGSLLKGFTSLTSVLGTEAAILAMVGNEELTNRAYDVALKLEWSPSERELLEKNRNDERRHLEWFKMAARKRPWAHEEEAHP